MTIKELREEIKRIQERMYNELKSNVEIKILDLRNEYLKNKGYTKHYMTSNMKKAELETYLECLINANYDILGYCL